MKNIVFVCFLLCMIFPVTVQSQLNDYKYMIVPVKFEDFKTENQYQTSTLVKFLLTQEGFTAVYSNALPEDLKRDRCLGLMVGLEDDSSMFSTKTSLSLTDCNDKQVLLTQEGRSKEKDFKDAYDEAIRMAFKTFEGITYAYEPAEKNSGPLSASFKNDIKTPESFKNKEETVSENKNAIDAAKEAIPGRKDANAPTTITEDKDTGLVQREATPEKQSYNDRTPQDSSMKKGNGVKEATEKTTLYAQELPDGFQLVDSTPSIRFKLLRTSMPNVYLVENETGGGLIFKMEGKWYYEHYDSNGRVTEKLNIKF